MKTAVLMLTTNVAQCKQFAPPQPTKSPSRIISRSELDGHS